MQTRRQKAFNMILCFYIKRIGIKRIEWYKILIGQLGDGVVFFQEKYN